ncbi:hypothetical protein HDU87_000733 [Geranomyces variabilis]|uniref:Uncharacterized protein n=1 Tax=Geranomyces variabilis TaxID=109894 RepID=A0AAD5XSY9_9FUNG|nr:hypothetical protein HDU87_000733 [Geranomyces variabilis]
MASSSPSHSHRTPRSDRNAGQDGDDDDDHEQAPLLRAAAQATGRTPSRFKLCLAALFVLIIALSSVLFLRRKVPNAPPPASSSLFGRFPRRGDPFAFLPCTNETTSPALEEADPAAVWARLFDPNPANWSWGNRTRGSSSSSGTLSPYEGRGVYLCGYLDVPLDYTSKLDPRVARLAVTKFQAAGLEPVTKSSVSQPADRRSERTIVVNPGGPGGSGTEYVWRKGEFFSSTYSDDLFDVLGWDPRGVNASLPNASCLPYEVDRDRYVMMGFKHFRAAARDPRSQLETADAFAEAVMRGCAEQLGDFPRFVSTAFVARDLDEIRKALGEEELTAVMTSYGTGIGQTYANMFPSHVGRMVLDGTEYVKDHRLVGGFGWTALDNTTDAWNDGFLGECVRAGPEHCALAKPVSSDLAVVTLRSLQARMEALFTSLVERPIPGFTSRSGPGMVTYSVLVDALYSGLYSPGTWPATAAMLADLENGNATSALLRFEDLMWAYNPRSEQHSTRGRPLPPAGTTGLGGLVICADSFNGHIRPFPAEQHLAPLHNRVPSLDWYESLWHNMTERSFVAGNERFYSILSCRHYATHWPQGPAETYAGDLNHTLSNPVLLVAETYDPATPLRNGRRLAAEMGKNARLVVHHGYGHSCTRDPSKCTYAIIRDYVLNGKVPTKGETDCFADGKPYGAKTLAAAAHAA